MGVRWLYDNKMVHVGLGTVERVRDYSIGKYWEGAPEANTFYFDFGTGINLDTFALITRNADNGTTFVSYSHDGTFYEGTQLVQIIYGTGKAFFSVGTHRYWKIGIFDPQDLKTYEETPYQYDGCIGTKVSTYNNSSITYAASDYNYIGGDYEIPTLTYDSFVFGINRIDEIFLGKETLFGQEPIYPFERNITYTHNPLETEKGKRFDYHKSKKRSWHFDYANIRTSIKDNINSFHDVNKGGHNPFWVSISDDETDIYIGRIDQKSFNVDEVAKNCWNTRFEVIEDFGKLDKPLSSSSSSSSSSSFSSSSSSSSSSSLSSSSSSSSSSSFSSSSSSSSLSSSSSSSLSSSSSSSSLSSSSSSSLSSSSSSSSLSSSSSSSLSV